MKEIWKDIRGYEGKYQISNFGRVKSLVRKYVLNEKILKQKDRSGYKDVNIGIVHRLVAEAFIPNPENKSQVNHIDGVKSNNRVDNLEWITPKKNIAHAYDMGLIVSKSINQKLTDEEVIEIYKRSKSETVKSLSKEYEVSQSTIYGIKNKKSRDQIKNNLL